MVTLLLYTGNVRWYACTCPLKYTSTLYLQATGQYMENKKRNKALRLNKGKQHNPPLADGGSYRTISNQSSDAGVSCGELTSGDHTFHTRH